MPIYEYQCKRCYHQFDELQKVDAEPLTECPECKQKSLVKLMSAPSFRLKGSGWYETDFKKDNRKNLADDGSSKEAKPAAAESDKSSTASGSKEPVSKSSDSSSDKSKKTDTKKSGSSSSSPTKKVASND